MSRTFKAYRDGNDVRESRIAKMVRAGGRLVRKQLNHRARRQAQREILQEVFA